MQTPPAVPTSQTEEIVGFRRFTKDEYETLRTQHNIVALVGNGFDIQVTRKYNTEFSPRYEAFYNYLEAHDFDSGNPIVAQMSKLKTQKWPDWSDLENAITTLVSPDSGPAVPAEEVYRATTAIQAAFSEYLERVAPPALLAQLGRDSSSGSLSVRSLSEFIQDVARSDDFPNFQFPATTGHYDLFNYLFVNFNYTPLLDDYIYRDQEQWAPQAHKWADRNFWFRPNPSGHPRGYGNEDTAWSSYLRTEVVHPHGQQSIPRSLLFGIDAPDRFNPGTHPHAKLMKPYWAMNRIEFSHLFDDAQLFIIFGCSLGLTDGWWWRQIMRALSSEQDEAAPRELIIYWWTDKVFSATAAEVLDRFFEAASVAPGDDRRQRVHDRIHVVAYGDDDPPVFLSL